MMSQRILRARMRTKWMVQAPIAIAKPVSHTDQDRTDYDHHHHHHLPLACTQFAFKLGNAAWSLVCSSDSAGS